MAAKAESLKIFNFNFAHLHLHSHFPYLHLPFSADDNDDDGMVKMFQSTQLQFFPIFIFTLPFPFIISHSIFIELPPMHCYGDDYDDYNDD